MSKEFEIVESTRRKSNIEPMSQNSKFEDALSDNMGSIIGIAKDIVDIQRMKVQSDAVLAKMAEDRKMLLAKTEDYATRKKVDTDSIVGRMNVIKEMLRDFYSYNEKSQSGLSGDEFTKIIKDVLDTMGRG